MSKAVPFKMPAPKPQTADDWVGEGVEPHLKKIDAAASAPVATKRLTLDLPAELHARFKIGCTQRGVTMLETVCRFLEAEFPA
jgi:hypothetical protein